MNAVLRTKFTPYSLLTAAFSIPRFFLSGKLLHTKKQTPAALMLSRLPPKQATPSPAQL